MFRKGWFVVVVRLAVFAISSLCIVGTVVADTPRDAPSKVVDVAIKVAASSVVIAVTPWKTNI